MYRFDLLKEERERLGYSQPAFAALVNATKQAQINWEKGIASPNATALAAWADVGLDVLYVVTGDRSFEPPKKLTSEEETMLEYFSQADKEARKAALRALLSVGPISSPGAASVTGNKNQVSRVRGSIQIGKLNGQQIVGDQTNHGPLTFGVSPPKPKKSSK